MDGLRTVAIVLVIAVVLLHVAHRSEAPIHLVTDALGNEALIASASLSTRRSMLFLLDTAYAGAPVLSLSYLALPSSFDNDRLGIETRYRRLVDRLRTHVTPEERHSAVARFLTNNACRTFTSGCTMRLMGIGETTEAQSDMLLCDGLHFSGRTSFGSDVFVTNPLPSSVHILTVDYLLHRAPCVIAPRQGLLRWRVRDARLRSTFEFHKPFFVGGAFRVQMLVGGAPLNIVIDTGAAAALSISPNALSKIHTCTATASPLRAMQRGVNGESVCSDVFFAHVMLGRWNLGAVQTFANSSNVEGADGYAGMGLLRALDIWLAPDEIGFRPSGLPVRTSSALQQGSCPKGSTLGCLHGGRTSST